MAGLCPWVQSITWSLIHHLEKYSALIKLDSLQIQCCLSGKDWVCFQYERKWQLDGKGNFKNAVSHVWCFWRQLMWAFVMNREAYPAAICGSQRVGHDWATELNWLKGERQRSKQRHVCPKSSWKQRNPLWTREIMRVEENDVEHSLSLSWSRGWLCNCIEQSIF